MSPPFPQLSPDQQSLLTERLLHWSLANGLTMYPPQFKTFSPVAAPMTLFPTPFPREAFLSALAVQETFNQLYINVVTNTPWLTTILESLSEFDPDFTGKLFSTYKAAVQIGIPQPVSMGLFRSDYMVHGAEIKQIEFNTVSVSFGGLSSKIAEAHSYLNNTGAYTADGKKYYDPKALPASESIEKLASGLADGHAAYNESQDTSTVVLVVVQPGERNVFDQRHIEYSLLKRGIKSVRMTLGEITTKTTVDAARKLYVNASGEEVSVVYFRSGYAPADYVNESTWEARLHLETSLAVKCPSLLTQLSGSKKIQQILTTREQIVQFLPDAPEAQLAQLLSTFVDIYPLDDTPRGQLAKKLAFEQSEHFVLKPQREGGGNNIYKENIPGFLRSLDEKEWAGYILMALISPPRYDNKIVRSDETFSEPIISELGVFGTAVFNEQTGEILTNKTAGWLLRSKFESSNEGGVAAGFGCVDSVVLY
ncbi:hypothetical protein BABINDRAFT_41735 [Babjeviella inositovora NRRL Y-12698]|uniref:Glutathione synthetase n=1 Tax=Babjeviella inositovora NRRL Y-12698 TaxID=984486 RepID=A0A1E3QHW0_9ASCO|nr:uncharacterized protein BABINDRAFT_41735 [Babjeviella inositovora NRRL Y-12698]ODQ77281.1 hypothetical protein BABINDRAFT_41735 [Babjeviella inositovora NRRL Y-12698]